VSFFVAFALTEPGCGSGVDIRSTAEKKGDKYILNGQKTLISFTDVCDAYYIIAVTDESKRKKGGHTAFYVPADAPGLRVENMPHMMGCRGTGHGDVFLENCEVPEKYRLGEEGEGLTIFLNALAVSRASIGVCLLGLSQRFLEMAIARQTTGSPLASPLSSGRPSSSPLPIWPPRSTYCAFWPETAPRRPTAGRTSK
jgi:alkylation response protein AidB-like acyl-CoA dehydrogenase